MAAFSIGVCRSVRGTARRSKRFLLINQNLARRVIALNAEMTEREAATRPLAGRHRVT